MNECFWDSIELDPEDVDVFTKHLKEEGIYYEASGCFNKVHFEVKLESKEQEKKLAQWIEDTYYIPLF